jgi:hypothetical protein
MWIDNVYPGLARVVKCSAPVEVGMPIPCFLCGCFFFGFFLFWEGRAGRKGRGPGRRGRRSALRRAQTAQQCFCVCLCFLGGGLPARQRSAHPKTSDPGLTGSARIWSPRTHRWCDRHTATPPRTKLAALRSGVPTFSGLRDVGRGARTTQKARRSSAGALLNISHQPTPHHTPAL